MFRIAICDDELKEAGKIQKIVGDFMKTSAMIHTMKVFTSAEELIGSKEIFDLVFLDISMNGMNGLEAGMKLYQRNLKIRLIYVTSYHQFLHEAVNHTHAFAYLTKPIKEEELSKQVSEAVKMIGMEKENGAEIELRNVMEAGEEKREYLAVKIPVPDILYFEYIKANRRIRIKTINKIYEYAGTMVDAEKKMQLYEFGSCYRGLLVNLRHVMKAKGDTVYLNTGETLPLSQKRAVSFKNQLNDFVHRSI